MADALYDIRHLLSGMIGDLPLKSVASAASTSTLRDDFGLAEPDDDWNGAWLYVYQGLGQGQERMVADFASHTLFLATAWATVPISGSKYEVHRSWKVTDHYNPFIKMAFRSRRKRTLLAAANTSTAMVSDTYEYDVPTNFATISEVWKEDSEGDFATPIPLRDLWIDRANKHLCFEKSAADNAGYIENGLHLRIIGQKYDTEPTAEADTFAINTTPLIWLAKAYLHAAEGNDASMGAALQAAEIDMADDETPMWPGSLVVEEG